MVHKLKTIRADMLVLQCQLERELIRYVKRYLCQPQVTIITNDKQFAFMCELYDYVENTELPPEMVSSLMKTKNVLELSANWQMMAMLNILISICGACMMYHTEYADNGMQKMSVLPIRQGSMFFGKFLIAALVLSTMVVIEMAVLVGCAKYWFPSYVFDLTEILKTAGFQIIVTLPTVMLMLVIASACKNMWVSLGIGVILVFTLSILPQDNIVLSLFPFASPYQMLSAAVENSRTALFLAVCGIETVVFGIAEVLYLQVRRCFE